MQERSKQGTLAQGYAISNETGRQRGGEREARERKNSEGSEGSAWEGDHNPVSTDNRETQK